MLLTGGPGPTIHRLELAGNALSSFPYFEYVRAFHQSAPLQFAIDPTLHPEIVGAAADIYVVEHKSEEEWQVDPLFLDVTAGGPLSVVFAGGTVQANTFEIAAPDELSAAAYEELTGAFTGLGHGYDMVVDMNANGVLDGSDFIDGLGREAGLYVVHDTTQPGPLAVTEAIYNVDAIYGITPWDSGEDLYYPTDVAGMGELPLLVIGHGSGHDYRWYDHIGYHMASYGYIVMSHANTFWRGLSTCGHTDAFLELLPSIAGGALVGHVDSHRIIWCGHSMGGAGVTEAYHSITMAAPYYVPTHYGPEDIRLVDAMLPTDASGAAETNPGDVSYHLWTASGDADVSYGTFRMHDRATRFRQSTVVQGAGHAWFHDAGGDPWFEGPCPIYEDGTHLVQLGLMLPLYKHYAQGNIPGEDYLWRQYERFHPPAVPVGSDPCFVVSQEYRNHADGGIAFIDDYETHLEPGTSSSGGAVTFSVANLTEGRLYDNDYAFGWTSSDPFNGATQDGMEDQGKGVVFDWDGTDAYYEWAIVPELRNFALWKYLSFRGAQGTRHPCTLATDGILTFSVTLRDATGNASSVNIGAYGGGFGMPYAREGGWHNEMRRIRIRSADFLANGGPLDLQNIVAVTLDVGPSWGTNQGRIVIDELMLDNDLPARFAPLTLTLSEPLPEFSPPYVPIVLDVAIDAGDDTLVAGSPTLHYRYDAGAWISQPLQQIDGTWWRGTLPAPDCGDQPQCYFSAQGAWMGMVYLPPGGPAAPLSSAVGTYVSILEDDFETELGWTVYSAPGMSSGMWARAVPAGWSDDGSPPADFDGSGTCFLTDNRHGFDVDGGPTELTSPLLDLSAAGDPVLRFAEWFYCDDADTSAADYLDVHVSSDGGATWVQVAHLASHDGWVAHELHLAEYMPLTATAVVRFSTVDSPNNSRTEAGIDAFEVSHVYCE